MVGDVELEGVDIAIIQSRIDEELTTEISSTGTQCHVFRCPSKSSIKKNETSPLNKCAKLTKMYLYRKFTNLIPIPRI